MRNHSHPSRFIRSALFGLCLAGSAGLAFAQQSPQPDASAPKRAETVRSDHMRGEGMRGHAMAMMCADNNEMSMHFVRRFEMIVQPKPEQKADFDVLKDAVAKADKIFKAACPTDAERADMTPVGRLARMEKTAQATVDAMKLVRPAFETLYAKLDDKQRDRMRWAQHGGHPDGLMHQMHGGMHPMVDAQ